MNEIVTFHGKNIEEMSRGELLAAMREAAVEVHRLLAQVNGLLERAISGPNSTH